MGNKNYYNSENSSVYGCYSEQENNGCGRTNSRNEDCNESNECRECNSNEDRNCCGKKFNNRPSCNSMKIKHTFDDLEEQLANTQEAILCLNNIFNCLEDEIYEDRCCLSNRMKNILNAIQKDICDLEDDVKEISDDLECLEQAL